MNKITIRLLAADTLLDIVLRVRALPSDVRDVVIDLDTNHVLTQLLNVKTLLATFPSKRFSFVVSGLFTKKLAEPLGVRYYTRNDDIEFEREYEQKHLLKHNFTPLEYFRYEVTKIFSRTVHAISERRKRFVYKNRRMVEDSNALLLVLGVALSLFLLLFIFYFTVSRTYVYISPQLTVKTASRNLIFREDLPDMAAIAPADRGNFIPVRPLSFDFSVEQTFPISVFDEASTQNAQGTVDVFNEIPQEQTLRPKTRLVTEDGLVYRTEDWIKIGAGRDGAPAKTSVRIVADMYDSQNAIIGVRGNIADGVLLTMPGLKFNRDRIYAKTHGPLTGGIDPKVHRLTSEELTKFTGIITEFARTKALERARERVSEYNAQNNAGFDIIPIPSNTLFSDIRVDPLDNAKVGDRIDTVRLRATLRLKTYMYDKNATLFYLKSVLNDSILTGTEKLLGTNEDSVRISTVLSRQDTPYFSLKGTTELDGTISYDFENPSNNLTKKLKNLILGTKPEEARSILLNNTNIASVRIQLSPFWLSHVSGRPDNIEFIIKR